MKKTKKTAFQLIAMLLCVCTILSVIPMQAFAEDLSANDILTESAEGETAAEEAESTDEAGSENESGSTEPAPAQILAEDTDKREESVKHFRMSDGTIQAAQYAVPVHFEQNGVWTDYDNTLTEVDADEEENDGKLLKNKDLTNQAADYSVRLSKKTNGHKFVRLEKDGYKISWYYLNANKSTAQVSETEEDGDPTTLEKLSSAVVYENVYKATDFEYILNSQGVKENLLLQSTKAPTEFTAEYKAVGLTPVSIDTQTVELRASDGTVVYTLSAPYMEDANGETSTGVTLTLGEIKNDTFRVTLTLDSTWLQAEERAFPVTVDPVIKTEQSVSQAQTAFVSAANPNKCYLASGTNDMGSLYVGNISGYGRTESYIKFTSLPNIGIASKVVAAYLHLGLRKCEFGLQVNIKRLIDNWDENTVTWNNGPHGESYIADYMTLTENTDTSVMRAVEITDMVRGWYSGEYPNYGLSLTTEKTAPAKAWFHSIHYTTYYENRPIMVIAYRNMSGYEDYWSYTNLSAGRGGIASVNNFNGNFVFAEPITQDDGGNLLPVNFSLIYNSNQEKRFSYELKPYIGHSIVGANFQTNYHMYIRYDSKLESEGYKYYLNDVDGTRHWLKKETENNKTVYKDEDGLGYTLTEISKNSVESAPDAVFQMVDKNETKYYFDGWGNLIQMKNAAGITNNLTYSDAGNNRRLETVTDGAGRTYRFLYNWNGQPEMVTGVQDPAGRITVLQYNSDFTLKSINFADGEKVELFYNSSALLSEIRGIDGTHTKISYDSSAQKRVTGINWGASDSNLLEKYTFAYKQNSTTVTDVLLDRSYTYQFNDLGQFTGIVSDKDGSAQFYKWAQPTSVTDSRANKLTQESQVLQTVTNYVVNPGFTRAYADGYVNYIENTANQSISIDTSRKNITNSALKVYKAASNTGRVNAVQYVNGLSAGTYTFSAYVNTEGATIPNGVSMFVEIWNASNACIGGYFIEQTTKTDGWERKSVTFTLPQGCTARLVMGLGGSASGTVWYDDLQLEKGEGESTFNLVENSGFTNGMTCWASEGGEAGTRTWAGLTGFDYCGKLPGTVEGQYKSLLQMIPVSGKKGDVFSFGMWAYASSAPIENGTKDGDPYQPDFEIVLHYYDASGRWKGYIHLNCNPDLKNAWQFVTEEAIIPEDYGKISISLLYNHNVNAAYMTGAFCFKEQYGQTYDYDKDGNVVSTVDLAKTNSTFAYYGNQMAKMLNPSGSKYLYNYNDKKQLYKALSSDGQEYGFSYDDKGNVTKAEITARKPATSIESGKKYILVNSYSGLAMDSHWDTAQPVTTYHYSPSSTQQHWLVELVSGTTDVYTLKSVHYGNRYLDVKGGGNGQGTALQTYAYNGGNAQKFKIVKKQDNTFALFTACSNYTKVLDGQLDKGNEIVQSQTVKQANCNPDNLPEGMRWYFYPVEATEDKTIVTETTYTTNGNFAATSKDQRGNTTAYQYDETKGTLKKTIDALNRVTEYTYYPNNKLETVSSGGMTNTYTYEKDRLDTIDVNGALQYTFAYDAFGRTTATQVGNDSTWRTLSSIEYAPNGQIAKQTYGNQDYIENSYDDLDRIIEKKYNGSSTNRAVYKYGTNGKLSQSIDFATNTRTKFVYDLANRVVSEREYTGTGVNGGTLRSSTDFTYADKTNYLTGVKHFSPLGTQNIGYTYGDINQGQMPDQVYSVSWNGQHKLNNSYDALGRLNMRVCFTDNLKMLINRYRYVDVGEDKTTTLLEAMRTEVGTYNYTYDAVGNIASISLGTEYTNSYEYDALNQLVRENNQQIGKTYTYAYVNGNITERKEYAYTTGELGEILDTKTWSYTDSSWSDLLTSFNGDSISYDLSGNPTAIGGQSLSWNGRQLQQIVDGANTYNYAYNTDDQRVSKTVNGVTTEYFYNGEILAGQKTGDDTLVFMYDNDGDPFGFIYNGTPYYYVKNAQNDVVAILDSNKAVIAKYQYDAWGKVTSVTDADGNEITNASNIGLINPIRYRSYYYDSETNLYYLNSRYYSPEMCRFLNADDSDIIDGGNDHALENNLFAYCLNNPIIFKDEDGEWVHLAVGAAVGAVVSGAISAISQYKTTGNINWGVVGVNAVSGAISGAIASTGISLIASVGVNAALGAGTYIAEQKVKREKVTRGGVLASFVAGGIGGAIGGKGTNAKGFSKAWKAASQGIRREARRANVKYAAKQTVRYAAQKAAIKTSIRKGVAGFTFGTIGNTYIRCKLGY